MGWMGEVGFRYVFGESLRGVVGLHSWVGNDGVVRLRREWFVESCGGVGWYFEDWGLERL